MHFQHRYYHGHNDARAATRLSNPPADDAPKNSAAMARNARGAGIPEWVKYPIVALNP